MALTARHKLMIVLLLLYWPFLFIATHIPQVPTWVGRIGVSDKALHFMAYLVLVFLFWSVLFYEQRVRWGRPGVWLVLLVVVFYGIADEILQYYVGRSADVFDFLANLGGSLASLAILTFFGFYAGASLVGGIILVTFSNFSRVRISQIVPISEYLFYFGGYGVLSGLWGRHIYHNSKAEPPGWRWLMVMVSMPVGVLFSEHMISMFSRGVFGARRLVISVAGILVVVLSVMFWSFLKKRF